MDKKTKLVINIFIMSFCLLMSFCGVIASVSLFWVGFHNSDLGHNMRYLEARYDINLIDINNKGEVVTGEESYRTGTSQYHKAFYLFGFCIGYTLYCFYLLVMYLKTFWGEYGEFL